MHPGRLLAIISLAASVTACHAPSQSNGPQHATSPAPPATVGPESCWIGVLRKNVPLDDAVPSQYCLEDSTLWAGAPYRLGRRNVVGLRDVPSALEGKSVLVRGASGASLLDALTPLGPCTTEHSNSLQFRSDWTADEGGYKTTRAKVQAAAYIRAASVEPFAALQIAESDAKVSRKSACEGVSDKPLVLTLHNPTSDPWDTVVLLHYEGGRGKPMPKYERRKVAVQPGQDSRFEIPAAIVDQDPGQRACWTFASAELIGAVGACEGLTAFKTN